MKLQLRNLYCNMQCLLVVWGYALFSFVPFVNFPSYQNCHLTICSLCVSTCRFVSTFDHRIELKRVGEALFDSIIMYRQSKRYIIIEWFHQHSRKLAQSTVRDSFLRSLSINFTVSKVRGFGVKGNLVDILMKNNRF